MQIFQTGGWGKDLIKRKDIDRATESSVWIDGRRRARRSGYENYFDTWDEAHAFLLDAAEKSLNLARSRLEQRQGSYGNIKGLKRPEGV